MQLKSFLTWGQWILLEENEFPDDECQIQDVGVIDLLWFSK